MSSCGVEEFDTAGAWVNGTHQLLSWQCPINEWNRPQIMADAHSQCRTTRNPHWYLWRDYMVPGCPRVSTFDAVSANRTLFFSGDSMSHMHWHAFVCRQLAEGLQRQGCDRTACRDRTRRPFGQKASSRSPDIECHARCGVRVNYPVPDAITSLATRDRRDEEWWKQMVPRDCVELSLGANHYRTCFVSNNQTQIELLHRAGAIRRGDVLIMNSGLTEKGHDLESTLKPLAAMLVSFQSRGIRVLWRETHPQHFPPPPANLVGKWDASTRGFFQFKSGSSKTSRSYHKPLHKYYRQHGRCEPAETLQRTALVQRDLDLFRGLGIPTILIWGLSNTQWDIHREVFSPHAYTVGALDCTHYCTPSGVMEAWVDATTNALALSWGRRRSARSHHGRAGTLS
jgi:hypothetical protein